MGASVGATATLVGALPTVAGREVGGAGAGVGPIGAAVGAGAYYMRDVWRRYRLAYVGIIYVVVFVIIRAASFHHVDQFFKCPESGNSPLSLPVPPQRG